MSVQLAASPTTSAKVNTRSNWRSVPDAFGKGSPSMNLGFPRGNLTAAEILAYCPHWLKTVDVVHRFLVNGGKAVTIAAMVNGFRDQPGGDTIFRTNSVCKIMQNTMRPAGYENWTIGTHINFCEKGKGEWSETNLDVSEFRTSNITHPSLRLNDPRSLPAPSLQFRDLALHVKKHPSGHDALDLTRCVLYAVNFPGESWLFPTDFEALVNHLGGPSEVGHLNSDRQVFLRWGLRMVANPLTTSAPKPNFELMARTPRTPRTRRNGGAGSFTTPVKGGTPVDDTSITPASTIRRSGRKRTKPIADGYVDELGLDDAEKESNDKPFGRIAKKLKFDDDEFSREGSLFRSNNATSTDETISGVATEDDFTPLLANKSLLTPVRKVRRAADKARQSIKDMRVAEVNKPRVVVAKVPDIPVNPIDPALMAAAAKFDKRQPVHLKPPVLSRNRPVVDGHTIHIYSEEGAKNLWASALSSTRFNNGPRRSPPFRELYRLTDPYSWDTGDWAENIRWAKEQEKLFGSKTWTEYDDHLEQITTHRRETMWVSEEAIKSGY